MFLLFLSASIDRMGENTLFVIHSVVHTNDCSYLISLIPMIPHYVLSSPLDDSMFISTAVK